MEHLPRDDALQFDFIDVHRDGPAFLDSFRGLDKWNSIGYAATARG
jgi:hypothetical protein